jgi:2-keto-4-pentenoate hydratase/2-oxohepta-3-ene-1,7-dioic acid hydratase in catechol pathway
VNSAALHRFIGCATVPAYSSHLSHIPREPFPPPRQFCSKPLVQNSHTSNRIFRIPALIAFISAAITLEPGDIIATGTPWACFANLRYFSTPAT